jgi:rRNA-processing protein FCF1
MPVKVIVDSNFLMIPSKFRIDIFRELPRTLNRRVEVIVLSPVYEELHNISLREHPKISKQAEMALKIIEGLEIVDIKSIPEETVDNIIIRIAKEWNCPVATNDGELRKKLRKIKIPVIYLRQGVRLEIDGGNL